MLIAHTQCLAVRLRLLRDASWGAEHAHKPSLAWLRPLRAWHAGTSSFGMSGVNAHLLVSARGQSSAGLDVAGAPLAWQRTRVWPAPFEHRFVQPVLHGPATTVRRASNLLLPDVCYCHAWLMSRPPCVCATILRDSTLPETLHSESFLRRRARSTSCACIVKTMQRTPHRFSAPLSQAAPLAWLRDHCVTGRALMPATAFIEAATAAVAALRSETGDSVNTSGALVNTSFRAPLLLPAAEPGDGNVSASHKSVRCAMKADFAIAWHIRAATQYKFTLSIVAIHNNLRRHATVMLDSFVTLNMGAVDLTCESISHAQCYSLRAVHVAYDLDHQQIAANNKRETSILSITYTSPSCDFVAHKLALVSCNSKHKNQGMKND